MSPKPLRPLSLAFACLLALFLLLPSSARAQKTLNVGAGQPYTTIQSAINAAQNGDTVLVAPGTYTENINFNGKAITVTSSGGPAVTTIIGGKQAATVAFINNEARSSVLSYFTVSGGGDGTSFAAQAGAQGGIAILLASPTITGNIITGAGCYGIGSQAGSPLIQNNTVSHTHVNSYTNSCGDGDGSGIWLTGFSNPYGNFPIPPQQPPQVLHNLIELNTECAAINTDTPGGAGIAVRHGTTPVIAYNIIRKNSIVQPSMYGGFGGGILVFAAGATVANNLIYGNTAVSGGGGIAVANFGTGATPVILVNNTVADNGTLPSEGIVTGGEQLYFGGYSPVHLENNLLSGNTTSPTMVCFETSSPIDPTAPLPVTFVDNDIFNSGGPTTGGFNGSSCNYPVNASGNQSADPLFVSNFGIDYHLTRSSPAIDAGSNASLTGFSLNIDLDGNPRVQDTTGDGCTVDIGAYEYPGTNPACGTQLTLTSSLNPSTLGQPVTFTAQPTSAHGQATGTIQFSDGTTVLSTQSTSTTGTATFSTTLLTVGTHTITATYQPAGNLPASSAGLTQVVNGLPSTTALASSANPALVGQPVTFTASVTAQNDTPTGTVTFADGGNALATQQLVTGTATFSTTALGIGSHSITATYSPSGNYAGSSATLAQTINGQPTTTTLGVTPNPATAFGTLTLTSTASAASGTPSGSVMFRAGTLNLGTAALGTAGNASLNIVAPPPGTYNITATYSGDAVFSASTSAAISETVLAAPTSIALSSSPNPAYQSQPVTLSAQVMGIPGQVPAGLVTFFDGPNSLGTSILSASGAASLSVTSLTPGTHTLTASFAGATSYAASTSTPVQQIILPGTFGLVLLPSTITLHAGQQGTVQVALSSIGGFSGPLTLTSGSMPTYTSSTFNPTIVSLAAGGSGSANLLLNTAMASLGLTTPLHSNGGIVVFAALGGLLLPLRSRARARHVLSLLFLMLTFIWISGCGTIGVPFHTTAPGTYLVQITGTDTHGNSHSATLTITITQ